MSGDNQQDKSLRMLRNHVAALMEHFDSVQIFATKPGINGGTVHCADGGGNWFARYGQIALWFGEQTLSDSRSPDEDDFLLEV